MDLKPLPTTPYPRGTTTTYGSSEKLQRLYRGCIGFKYTYYLLFAALFLIGAGADPGTRRLLVALGPACLAGAIYMGIRSGEDVGFGSGWPKFSGGIGGFLCMILGGIPLVIFWYVALVEIRRYGIKTRSFGNIDRKVMRAKIDEISALESLPKAPGAFKL